MRSIETRIDVLVTLKKSYGQEKNENKKNVSVTRVHLHGVRARSHNGREKNTFFSRGRKKIIKK